MNYLVFTLGVLLVLFSLSEVFVTTLAPRGAGFLSQRLRKWVWKVFFWLARGRGSNKLLNYVGMFTIVTFLVAWLSLYWIGNALIFISKDDSILSSSTKTAAAALEKFYFVGYVLSTMGLGDYIPNGTGWQLYTSVISFSGFIIITLGLSYLNSIYSAEVAKRRASIYIHSLGTSPQAILLNSWNGRDFSNLAAHFQEIAKMVMQQSQKHVAYSILHNFHSHLKRESFSLNLAALDEALSILLLYIPDGIIPDKLDIYHVRYSIADYLASIREAFIDPSDNTPGSFALDELRRHGIPLKEECLEIKEKARELILRRKLLLDMIENEGGQRESIFMGNAYTEYDIGHTRELREENTRQKDDNSLQ